MKELIEPITKTYQIECLENIFGDEDISDLKYDDGGETEYELECVLRRKL